MTTNQRVDLLLALLAATALLAPGCSSSASKIPTGYSTEKGPNDTLRVTIYGINRMGIDDMTVVFALHGRPDGERIHLPEALPTDKSTSGRSSAETFGGNLKVIYVVGKGMEEVSWEGQPIPKRE